jgi:hypothetical protein
VDIVEVENVAYYESFVIVDVWTAWEAFKGKGGVAERIINSTPSSGP